MRLTVLFSAVVAVAALISGSAQALDAECMWRTLPAERQAELLNDYRQRGANSRFELSDAEEARFSACGVNPGNKTTADIVFLGAFMQRASALVLADQYGVTPATLDAAWAALSPDQRVAVLRAVVSEQESDALNQAAVDAGDAFRILLKLPDAASAHVAFYMTGRAMFEAANATEQHA